MPPATTKKAQPVKFSSYRYDGTVRDCLVWPDPHAQRSGEKEAGKTTYILPTKGGLGKPTTRNFELPEDPYCYGAPVVDDGCHVTDAMRGWPNAQQDAPIRQEFDLLRMETPIEQEAKKRKTKKTKKVKKTGAEGDEGDYRRTRILDERGPDAQMGELISHRFLSEAAKERSEAREREMYEKQMKIRRERDRRFPKDIKGTKTTQLRSIALSEKVHYGARDLWQMSKFKRGASPRLNTFRSENLPTTE